MGDPSAQEEAPLYVRWANGWYTLFVVAVSLGITLPIAFIAFQLTSDQTAALTGACNDLYVFLWAQFLMWTSIVAATSFHYLTSFNSCSQCHRGNTGFALSMVVLILGPVMMIAAAAYASSVEGRYNSGSFATCGDAFGLYKLGIAMAWVSMSAPIVILLFIFVTWCLRTCRPAPAEPQAEYQQVPQSAM